MTSESCAGGTIISRSATAGPTAMKALSRIGANSTATYLMELPLLKGAVCGLKV